MGALLRYRRVAMLLSYIHTHKNTHFDIVCLSIIEKRSEKTNMGTFYTNITLNTSDVNAVIAYLHQHNRTAYVANPHTGYIVVYDSETESQDEELLTDLSERLSRQLACVAFAVLNHDDDVLMYWLYNTGTLLDHYNLDPGYFEDNALPPQGGDADLLCRLFGADADCTSETVAILHTPFFQEGNLSPTELLNTAMQNPESFLDMLKEQMNVGDLNTGDQPRHQYVFAIDRHAALVEVLGLPSQAVGFGFEYIENDELPDDLDPEDLYRVDLA